jgi:molecular chaperone GrpE
MAENTEKEKTVNSEVIDDMNAPNSADQSDKDKAGVIEEGSDASEIVAENPANDNSAEKEIQKLKDELQEAKDKYLRLYSEFENFRRRTARERLELIKTANEDLMVALIPVMDDFQRAQKALEESEDHKASKEGFDLIYNKFNNILTQKGLKAMDDKPGADFNTVYHEAISQMPVEKKKLKGKVIDVVEKGYFLDEKVIRFAKVVIGA